MAARQTAGRGRDGRRWESLPGNLALSVLLRPPGAPSRVGQWALLAAVALAEALERCAPPAAIRLKWPNDAMLDGAKLGGILLDSAVAPGRLDWLVIGFGANLAAAPGIPGRDTARLPGTVAPATAAWAVLDRLEHWQNRALLDGFAPVRAAWLARGPAPGAFLRLRAGNQEVGGHFAGLGEEGALLLQAGGRVRALHSGDVLPNNGG